MITQIIVPILLLTQANINVYSDNAMKSKTTKLNSTETKTCTEHHGTYLDQARRLKLELEENQKQSHTKVNGEYEHMEWWNEHEQTIKNAMKEYGVLHQSLYTFHQHIDEFIDPRLLLMIRYFEKNPHLSSLQQFPGLIKSLFHPSQFLLEPLPTYEDNMLEKDERISYNVYKFPLFTEYFCKLLIEELDHYAKSGIPLRRPNGMNRYGAILPELGMEKTIEYISHRILSPLGQLLYPWIIGNKEATQSYGFIVRYKQGEDLNLAKHVDSSVLTCNVNLGIKGFTGGQLQFAEYRGLGVQRLNQNEQNYALVDFSTDFNLGEAIFHLGQHAHEALPILNGTRINMIIWLYALHGVVRVAPLEQSERVQTLFRDVWE